MAFIVAFLIRALTFLALFLVVAGGAPSAFVYGAAGAMAAAGLSLWLVPAGRSAIDPIGALALLPRGVGRIALGAFDVARRALAPSMPLDPGWVIYRSRLPDGAARLLLTSETSLFPGSLVAARRGDRLYVHCLDRAQGVAAEFAREEDRIAKTLTAGHDPDARADDAARGAPGH